MLTVSNLTTHPQTNSAPTVLNRNLAPNTSSSNSQHRDLQPLQQTPASTSPRADNINSNVSGTAQLNVIVSLSRFSAGTALTLTEVKKIECQVDEWSGEFPEDRHQVRTFFNSVSTTALSATDHELGIAAIILLEKIFNLGLRPSVWLQDFEEFDNAIKLLQSLGGNNLWHRFTENAVLDEVRALAAYACSKNEEFLDEYTSPYISDESKNKYHACGTWTQAILYAFDACDKAMKLPTTECFRRLCLIGSTEMQYLLGTKFQNLQNPRTISQFVNRNFPETTRDEKQAFRCAVKACLGLQRKINLITLANVGLLETTAPNYSRALLAELSTLDGKDERAHESVVALTKAAFEVNTQMMNELNKEFSAQ